MEAYFRELSEKICVSLPSHEVVLLNYEGETTDFVRLNQNKIRQAGNVAQQFLQVDLIAAQKQSTATVPLCGDLARDEAQAGKALAGLREQLAMIPPNPHINFALQPRNSRDVAASTLPSPYEAIDHIITHAQGMDLVGIWASGQQMRGFANSLGQFNWHSRGSFNFDWSVYQSSDKAVKQNYAGTQWNRTLLEQKLAYARETLDVLARPPVRLKPGRYRVFLTPSALNEIMNLLNWGAFGLKSHRSMQTPLIKMIKEGARLHPRLTVAEHHAEGLTARFTKQGFYKPDRVTLIEEGAYRDCLANARDAKEYGVEVNCGIEHPQSLHMSGGELHQNDVLRELGRGIYVSNLWYCNYSDRNHCRITGMTRFASLWVESGQPVAPIDVMRFDESIYHFLGDKLIGLTREHEHILDAGTYEKRSDASAMLPGALVEDFAFTL